jgi:protein Mpv17
MPTLLSVAIQNTFIKASANLTAQLAAQWHSDNPPPLDRQRILEFAAFGFVGALVGFKWHGFLEDTFPTREAGSGLPRIVIVSPVTHTHDKDIPLQPIKGNSNVPGAVADASSDLPVGGRAPPPGPGIRWRNVWAKLVADQTVGLSFMITIFLFITNVARQPSLGDVLAVIHAKLFGLVLAGWHIWPAVAIVNFLWVPVRWRVLVGSVVGFGWNIFLSIVSMKATAAATVAAPGVGPPQAAGQPPHG